MESYILDRFARANPGEHCRMLSQSQWNWEDVEIQHIVQWCWRFVLCRTNHAGILLALLTIVHQPHLRALLAGQCKRPFLVLTVAWYHASYHSNWCFLSSATWQSCPDAHLVLVLLPNIYSSALSVLVPHLFHHEKFRSFAGMFFLTFTWSLWSSGQSSWYVSLTWHGGPGFKSPPCCSS